MNQAEEWLDVVDKDDNVVGRRTRSTIHRLQLFHRAVHVLVFCPSGKVFLQKRSDKKDELPGLWDSSSAGHVAAGEEYNCAAIRELREELGIVPTSIPQPLWKIPASRESSYEFTWVYRCMSDDALTLDPSEIAEGRWLQPQDVTTWIAADSQSFTPIFKSIWQRMVGGELEE